MHLRGTLSLIFSLLSLTHSLPLPLRNLFPENHHLLLPSSRKLGRDDSVYCLSWRLAVEINNAGAWSTIPVRCQSYVVNYFTDGTYSSDSEVVAGYSLEFAKTVEIAADGRDAWVFDVDETLLSNLPYYHNGTVVYDHKSFHEWELQAKAPALSASLNLYKELQQLGFKLFLLTGRSEPARNATEENLRRAGYDNWQRLILRGADDQGKLAVDYKSERRQELVDEGYRIHGNSGDQWSDLLGYAVAQRSFKLPNPLYYIA